MQESETRTERSRYATRGECARAAEVEQRAPTALVHLRHQTQ
jgi:hypothetical protein